MTAWAYTPTSSDEGGDVWLGTSKGYYTDPIDGNYAKLTVMHELGHAPGLGHPHQPVLGVGAGNFVDNDGAYDPVGPGDRCAGSGNDTSAFGYLSCAPPAGDAQHYGADTNQERSTRCRIL